MFTIVKRYLRQLTEYDFFEAYGVNRTRIYSLKITILE